MFTRDNKDGIQHVVPLETTRVENEIIVTTVKRARRDDHPHYLSVAAGAEATTGFGDPDIDGVLHRSGVNASSFSRVFVPRRVAPKMIKAKFDLATIASNYDKDEDSLGLSRTYRVALEGNVNIDRVCQQLCCSESVETAQPNYIQTAQIRPNDQFYGFQWGLPAINAEEAWDLEQGHTDVKIAIVDSGVDTTHPDLQGKLLQGHDFVDIPQGAWGWRYELLGDHRFRDSNPDDEDGHGSHCAGISAASSNDGRGVAGVCWGGSILPVRVMSRVFDRVKGRETSSGSSVDISAGIKFAVDSGAHVINLSLGGTSPSYTNVLQYAFDKNVCLIAATGNSDSSAAHYPAGDPNCLAVGAVDQNLRRASFSNYGPNFNDFVVAPGVQIASTYKDGQYVYLQGTSMATPFVAGLAALIISVGLRNNRQFSVDEVYDIIRSTCTSLGWSHFTGRGIVNAEAAVQAAINS